MALISMRQLLDHAAQHNYGVPAFNVNNMAENPTQFDPRKFLKASTQAMKEICKVRYEAFGCVGQGSTIQPLNLERMAQRYDAGELEPTLH